MTSQNPQIHGHTPAIILFTRHFPPHVSGGARRPFYLAEALESLGCKVFVVAPALPDGVEGLAVPHVQPDPSTTPPGSPGLRDFLRDWLFWPDPDIRWTKRALKALKAAMPFAPDWVMTTNPPESIHYAGWYLKKKLACHWYADARDHWLVKPFRKQRESLFRQFIEQKIARKMMGKADLISTVNEDIANEMAAYGKDKSKIFILPHFSIVDETGVMQLPKDQINLVYTGSFSLSDPDCKIENTLEVFDMALDKSPLLHLHIAGRLTANEEALVRKSPCAKNITLHGVVPLQQAHALQKAANALILAGAPHAKTPPGKAAEYASCDKPIIAISEAVWAETYNQGAAPETRLGALNADRSLGAQNVITPPSQYDSACKILFEMYQFA